METKKHDLTIIIDTNAYFPILSVVAKGNIHKYKKTLKRLKFREFGIEKEWTCHVPYEAYAKKIEELEESGLIYRLRNNVEDIIEQLIMTVPTYAILRPNFLPSYFNLNKWKVKKYYTYRDGRHAIYYEDEPIIMDDSQFEAFKAYRENLENYGAIEGKP